MKDNFLLIRILGNLALTIFFKVFENFEIVDKDRPIL